MFIAGENSGDLHASRLIAELRKLIPGLECFGYGGERMQAQGMRLDENLAQKLPIMGFTQVMRNYGRLKALLRNATAMLHSEKPDAVVLIDYPGFNLRIAAAAKSAGIPVIYYISPQIWAWHQSRLKRIAETVSLMLVILPFEEAIYRKAMVPVQYVGHPLQDDDAPLRSREEVRQELGVAPGKRLIGLLPGSRNSEIIRHLPIMLEAAQLLQHDVGNLEFVLPRASTVERARIERECARYPGLQLRIAEDDPKSVRAAMDFAICKSGTSTLELALLGVPMVIMYKVSLGTYLLAKAVVKIPWIGLVNIVANELVAPELIQSKASAAAIAAEVKKYLCDEAALNQMREQLARVKARIGSSGASHRAAESIADFLR